MVLNNCWRLWLVASNQPSEHLSCKRPHNQCRLCRRLPLWQKPSKLNRTRINPPRTTSSGGNEGNGSASCPTGTYTITISYTRTNSLYPLPGPTQVEAPAEESAPTPNTLVYSSVPASTAVLPPGSLSPPPLAPAGPFWGRQGSLQDMGTCNRCCKSANYSRCPAANALCQFGNKQGPL